MKCTFASLFKTPLHTYKFFFLYGNDLAVFDRIIVFLNKKLSATLEMTSEKELLSTSPSQFSLFEDTQSKALKLVHSVSDKILDHMEELAEGPYIFTSEKARAQSKLVTYFSASPHALAIGAYASPLTTSEFDFLVGDLNLPVSFKGLLFTCYQNDYRGLLTALEKIKVYGTVPEAAYASFLASSHGLSDLQPLIHFFLLKNSRKIPEVLFTLTSADMVPFLRSLGRSFQTLYELMPFKSKPHTIVWQKLSSPVFFKDQPIFQTALSRWQKDQIQRFLESLLALEHGVKYENAPICQIKQKLMEEVVRGSI
jgi:hypothetical protein